MTDTLKKLFYLLPKGDGIKITILFIMMIIAAILEIAGIGLIPAFVAIVAVPDNVLGFEPIEPILSYLNIQNPEDLLFWGSVALVLMFILKSAYLVFYAYFESRFLKNRGFIISHRLMNTYMQAPYTFHLKNNTSVLVRNTLNEAGSIVNSVIQGFLKIGKEGVMTLAIMLTLLFWEPLITLVVILLSVIGAGSFIMLTQKKVKRYGNEELFHRGKMWQAVYEGISGLKDARILNREAAFVNKFRLEAHKSTILGIYNMFIKQIPKPVVETTAVVGMMLISFIMIWQDRPMSAIIPTLTLFAIATVRLMPSVQMISSLYTQLRFSIASLDPVYDDLKLLEEDTKQFIADRKNVEVIKLKDKIEVRDLHYSYPDSSEQALKGISVTIPKGKAIAFVGESGAGKTTIVDLLLGLMKPTKGRITVDGKDIHENISGWQQNVGYIPQFIFLADDTLRNNIAFGLPEKEIDEYKIQRAVELAQLGKFVKKLPEGLDTIIGEHGARLSGGQRQRVGIARALYNNPEVLVMDEATSALDNITEKQVTRAIEALMGERTIIMIAHRLTTVKNCDQLYLMENGNFIQQGTYDQLIKSSSMFREMALETT
ncbi:ABC transporter ATP-binding protein/permease [Aliifodinibius sp. S!AR15-10]|uniref:ABC transporter ATP-binding protein n=1 Tax=Aliifodinibius sp. S!AR15-10 TaxID=2950437 RepID=UPI00285F0B78|nr:ABC transporter ATP-binding protein [Aliifodinibius sp. S!AR15-10]MDR8390236.1 ABC transporter ATP-binding protein/permease [Aliifodinibius sp. S!AR15-10]